MPRIELQQDLYVSDGDERNFECYYTKLVHMDHVPTPGMLILGAGLASMPDDGDPDNPRCQVARVIYDMDEDYYHVDMTPAICTTEKDLKNNIDCARTVLHRHGWIEH